MTTDQTSQSHGWPRMFLERLQPLVSGNPTHVPSLTVVCGVYLDSPLPPELAAESGRSVPRTRLITHAIKITAKDFEIPCHTPAGAPGTGPVGCAALRKNQCTCPDSQVIAKAVAAELDRRELAVSRRRSTWNDHQ